VSKELLAELYPNLSRSEESSKDSHSRLPSGVSRNTGTTDKSMEENPLLVLNDFIRTMGKKIADAILTEAYQHRD
jgi:hypothetical protein